MSADIFLSITLVAGLVLSFAYLKADYVLWRESKASDQRQREAARELHASRVA